MVQQATGWKIHQNDSIIWRSCDTKLVKWTSERLYQTSWVQYTNKFGESYLRYGMDMKSIHPQCRIWQIKKPENEIFQLFGKHNK
jgi:hypothetical protein